MQMQMRARVIVLTGLLCVASALAAGCRCNTSAPGSTEPTPTSRAAEPSNGPVPTGGVVPQNAYPRFSSQVSPHVIDTIRRQIAEAGVAGPDGG